MEMEVTGGIYILSTNDYMHGHCRVKICAYRFVYFAWEGERSQFYSRFKGLQGVFRIFDINRKTLRVIFFQ